MSCRCLPARRRLVPLSCGWCVPVCSRASQRRCPGLRPGGRRNWRSPIRCTAWVIRCLRQQGSSTLSACGRLARKKTPSPLPCAACACPACRAARVRCWSRRWGALSIPSAAMRCMSPPPRARTWPGSTTSPRATTKAGCWRPRAGFRCCWCAMHHRRTMCPTRSRPAACAGTRTGRRLPSRPRHHRPPCRPWWRRAMPAWRQRVPHARSRPNAWAPIPSCAHAPQAPRPITPWCKWRRTWRRRMPNRCGCVPARPACSRAPCHWCTCCRMPA